ncbi:TonB-dependent receptor plug domain-containing protein [Pelagicoccus sp. SDUM812002]|uniref:TonB-dependent receptor plug domain-containing protein n=1 Tax=Pelagicoccus sp. SDUM812002 TaxID=3041266 RepID=UPI00280DFCED|nr:TonB-dependent receptor plug domain-containing protein [Pelagicoccus sp. SDUM812002]MDQ8185729.1 hypothetical protein [Pelagicoccus sp. SDUM812002]
MLKNKNYPSRVGPFTAALLAASLAAGGSVSAQDAADQEDDEVFELSPFTVSGEEDVGYRATSSLAGTRLKTDLADIGSAISVYTEDFLDDVGAVDNETLLAYGLGTEVGGANGNFVNPNSNGLENAALSSPNSNTRVRGLTSADNTRNYFRTDVSWDGYIINRVDIQRGANSILFGLGSPAGIINATTAEASFRNSGKFDLRFDKFGSTRMSGNLNRVLVEDELAIRVAVLNDRKRFRQEEAYDDDRRLYAALSYTPKAINSDGMLNKLKASIETGTGESSRPRYVVPVDAISSFYLAPGETGFGGEWANYSVIEAQSGQTLAPGENGQLINQIYRNEARTNGNSSDTPVSMWLTGSVGADAGFAYDMAGPNFPNPARIREGGIKARGSYVVTEPDDDEDFDPYATIDNTEQGSVVGTSSFSMRSKQEVAGAMGLKYAGFWKDSSLADTTYFDFYNHTIDGGLKSQETDFNILELDWSSTFKDNMFGLNVSYYRQEHDSEVNAALGTVYTPSIEIDVGALDQTATIGNQVPNPYGGRAYIGLNTSHGGSNMVSRDRESKRLQAFFSYDFEKHHNEGFLSRLLGKQDFTGVVQQYELESRGQYYRPVGWGYDYATLRGDEVPEGGFPPSDYRLAELAQEVGDPSGGIKIYLDATGPQNTGLRALNGLNVPTGKVTVAGFNGTPRPGFSAEDAAMETFYNAYSGLPADDGNALAYQARNPANYVGWQDSVGEYTFVRASDDEASREYLTTRRSLNVEDVESTALVWTGRFWDGAFVGMYGWRKDDAYEAWPRHDYRDDGHETDLSIEEGVNSRSQEVQSRNWSAKLNVSHVFGLTDKLPFSVHALYAEGEVQTPDPSRIDVFGRTLPNATGNTEDLSLMLISNDGRWSFRATDYRTVVQDAVSSSTVNNAKWRIEQVLAQGTVGAGRIETDVGRWAAENLTLSASAEAAGYDTERAYRKEVMAPAWRAFEAELFNNFPLARGWYLSEFQPGDAEAPSVRFPDNATLVEDQVSEGYEFELTANVTENWRVAFNASKTQAIRSNLPGQDFGAVIDLIVDSMRNTPAGEIPLWWEGGNKVGTHLNPFLGEVAVARALNGAAQPEIREWKSNVITNYSFGDGRFKGLGLGGSLRWEDEQVYGYEPTIDPDTGDLGVNIDQAYATDARETVDLWVSYAKALNDKLDWKIQLNVRNAFGDNETVPLSRNPDGSIGLRGIREGMSWSVSNSFDF